MASASSNLIDELEEAFQSCIDALTKEETSTGTERDEIKLEVDQTTLKFIDLARQTEAFFLQKRFLLSVLKPEFLLKEENLELKLEITRKEDLIKKHYDKIETWKNMLNDPQQQTYKQGPPGPIMSAEMQRAMGGVPPGISANPQISPMGAGLQNPQLMQAAQQQQQQQQQQAGPSQQQLLQQQQQSMQQQQQQQQQQVNQQQQQQMYMQQNNNVSRALGGGFPNQNPNIGPLAYLEKTTSNIELGSSG